MKVLHQSVFDKWQIENISVQAVITSPPYYSLRKYDIPDVIIGGNPECEHDFQLYEKKRAGGSGKNANVGGNRDDFSNLRDGSTFSNVCIHCNAWQGQYGLEPNYKLYIEHTRLWAKEAWRVLKDNGVFFLNIADSYNGSNRGHGMNHENLSDKQKSNTGTQALLDMPLKEKNYAIKCQILIPHRVAIALVDDGWTLRNTVVWHKKNAMPESVADRFSKRYEYVFMFVKQQKYYFNLDAVKNNYKQTTIERCNRGFESDNKVSDDNFNAEKHLDYASKVLNGELKGTNPGDVWEINTSPSPEKHYAMWPEKLVGRMILCSTKVGDIVLDPFAGSGTTLRVADRLNRIGQGIDLGYHDIQDRRLTEIQKELNLT